MQQMSLLLLLLLLFNPINPIKVNPLFDWLMNHFDAQNQAQQNNQASFSEK